MASRDELKKDNSFASALGLRRSRPVEEQLTHTSGTRINRNVRDIELSRLTCDEQVRTQFDADGIDELAHSLKTVGQQQPCLVYYDEERAVYVIIAGERRFRAANKAELPFLTCYVHPHKPLEDEKAELQLIENVIRRDLNALEEARGYRRLMELKSFTTTQISERIGKNQSTVSRALSLLKLPEDMQEAVGNGSLPPSVGREIAKKKDKDEQRDMFDRYLRGELTTTSAAKEVARRGANAKSPATKTKKAKIDGISISVTGKARTTNAEFALALRQHAARLEADGRGLKRAA